MVQGSDVRGDEEELEGEDAEDEEGGSGGDGAFQFVDEAHALTLRGGGCFRRWGAPEWLREGRPVRLIVRTFEMG
ncbi:hypothetical protein GCM10018791_43190 [Streptomyces zaomyceticus]|nr:hypothetical protein GCM10018791_43190 [Streptomyces zaomyceticus]